ncbi:glyoxylase-like metal-dependent hydrolase (beta-lactamase superfamily II) [Crossiella equi]|uniref:Glyoxylase-like metal-dependent hydrolase (Beta-lactamase superfamily II) n=1 Tax=Crossiella equi TaxID=130796 RepID=A0ABS5A701_9PSEU|nr:MBL fold metallo-hydrolase [Crossiella equi]MBP2472086.1 glyoxylase-like metal-dependent hydrolase (beta-lactamase superfamily II) [Crossiella equi]
MNSIILGDVDITRVVEWQGPFAPTSTTFPSLTRADWETHSSWLVPDHWEPETDHFVATTQVWVLRSEGRVILVDTGIGDDKDRGSGPFHRLRTGFLSRLAEAGVRPEDVDVVVNTHAHVDHIGWNTRLEAGSWVPTFPNAQYLLHRADAEFVDPAHAQRPDDGSYADSIAPVVESGLLSTWDGDTLVLDRNLTLELASGHTPGSAALRLASGTDRALFLGDLVHSPIQVAEPDHEFCSSEDVPAAIRARRRYLAEAADTGALVVPAHFGDTGMAEVARAGEKFTIAGWR